MRSLATALVAAAVLSACSDGKLRVTEVRPDQGNYFGGEEVTIVGSGFKNPEQGVKVYFGKERVKVPPVILSDSEIKVIAPKGPLGTRVAVDLVFDDARRVIVPSAYLFIDPMRGTNPDAGP